MLWKGFKDVRATIEIDLTKTEEELWNNLDKDAKWGVKKAEKEGLIVEQTGREEDWKKFYGIYKDTMIYVSVAPADFDYFKSAENILFLCKIKSDIIAGAVIAKENEGAYKLRYNASVHEFLKYQPNNLLYWSLIKWGKNQGFKIFDLGGYQLNAKPEDKLYSVNKFKERWGGEIKSYYVYSYNPFYILGRKIIRNFPKIKAFREKIKMKKYLEKSK